MILNSLDAMRRRNVLCDVTITLTDGDVTAHRSVLAASCPYFAAMFTSGLCEMRQDTIRIANIDASTFRLVLDFIYKGEVQLYYDNVQSAFVAASMLQLMGLVESCASFFTRCLDPTNCLGIRSLASVHSCPSLASSADSYAQENFNAVKNSDEFLELSSRDLIDLISRDSLNVRREEDVYDAVMRWVSVSDERLDHLGSVLEHVRLPLVTWEFLRNRVGKNALFTTREDCKTFLKVRMLYVCAPKQVSKSVLGKRPIGKRPVLFCRQFRFVD